MRWRYAASARLTAVFLVSGCAAASAPSPGVIPTLEVSLVELGVVGAGSSATGLLHVSNRGVEPVSIQQFQVSCPCLRVEAASLPMPIVPGRDETIRVVFDTRAEPDFRGNLAIEVEGVNPAGDVVVKSTVRVAVE